jgi:hypothetical protein
MTKNMVSRKSPAIFFRAYGFNEVFSNRYKFVS